MIFVLLRDLIPENVMLTTSNTICYHLDYEDISKDYVPIQSVKIMDFGLSKVVGIYDSTIEGYGSVFYTAPEIILKRNNNHKVDVWSFGVLLYFCLTRLLAFDDAEDNINNIAKKIVYSNDIAKPKFLIEPQFDQRSFKLVLECLQKNPTKILSAENIVGNDWFIN